jgi:hypothetical protein
VVSCNHSSSTTISRTATYLRSPSLFKQRGKDAHHARCVRVFFFPLSWFALDQPARCLGFPHPLRVLVSCLLRANTSIGYASRKPQHDIVVCQSGGFAVASGAMHRDKLPTVCSPAHLTYTSTEGFGEGRRSFRREIHRPATVHAHSRFPTSMAVFLLSLCLPVFLPKPRASANPAPRKRRGFSAVG